MIALRRLIPPVRHRAKILLLRAEIARLKEALAIRSDEARRDRAIISAIRALLRGE